MQRKAVTLDDTDWKILRALWQNARSTFTEIGQEVGLTAPAVRERIRRMEDEDLIVGYRPIINREALGRSLHALVTLKLARANDAEYSELALFKKIPGVVRSWLVTGDTECVLEISVETMEELDGLLHKLNRLGFQTATYMILEDAGENEISKP